MIKAKGAITTVRCSIFILLSHAANGQYAIRGCVLDSVKAPIIFCAVGLINSADSVILRGELTDDEGRFEFASISAGSYRIRINAAGFHSFESDDFDVDSVHEGEIAPFILNKNSFNLKEVSVTAFKPTIEFKRGMIVMNVENNVIATGNTILELLRKMPGVLIDAQNNISINGRSGVRFMFNGKIQQVPALQMINMLSGMPAEAVSTIELITNPPARYDAEGTGGFINIVFKKAKVEGTSGSLSETVSYGTQWRNVSGVNLNFKRNDFTFFSNIFYSLNDYKNSNYTLKTIETPNGLFEARARGVQYPGTRNLSINTGGEWDITKKTTIGFAFNFDPDVTRNTETSRQVMFKGNPFPYDYYNYKVNTAGTSLNPNFNINLTHKLDTNGSDISFAADYTKYTSLISRDIVNSYFLTGGMPVGQPLRIMTDITTTVDVLTQKADHRLHINKTWELESGLKTSFVTVKTSGNVSMSDSATGTLHMDDQYSTKYLYNERVIAGYASVNHTSKNASISAGLRSEYTQVTGSTNPQPFVFSRQYLNIFPSGSADYKINDNHSLQLSYSYRLERPRYDQLNPVRVFNEQLNFFTGNPRLNPQYSHMVNLDYKFKTWLTLSASLQSTTGFKYYYSYGLPDSKVTIDTIFNYPHRTNVALSAFVNKQIKKFAIRFYTVGLYRAFRGKVQGIESDSRTLLYFFNTNIDISLPLDMKAQIGGWYVSKFTDGVQVYYPAGTMYAGLVRSFFDKKLEIMISLNDIFYTERFPLDNRVAGQYTYYLERQDTRRVKLYAAWKFGKFSVQQKTKKSNEEEAGRFR